MADSTTSSSSSSSSSSFLTLLLDINPSSWSTNSEKASLFSLLPVILVFLNSHLALSHSNGVAFYLCSTKGKGELVYSTASHSRLAQSSRGQQEDDDDDDDDGAAPYNEASTYQHFGQMNRAVIRGVKRMIASMEQEEAVATTNGDASKESGHDDDEEETAIVKVLSMALNHLNRIVPSSYSNNSSGGSGTNPLPPARSTNASATTAGSSDPTLLPNSSSPNSRILILSTTASASNQYIGLMNCIFAAQRRDVPIDVLKLSGDDTVFLQQASNLTGGIYFRLPGDDAGAGHLLQLLLSTFLPPPSLRKQLHLPALDEVDFRASCFCHGEIVDVGYVCGVCLSIFCHPPTHCLICSSPFPRRTLRKFQADLTAPRANQETPTVSTT